MEGNGEIAGSAPSVRRFSEADDSPADGANTSIEEICLGTGLPLEINSTDEPGGDPYNNTGRFRRMFR